MKKKKKVRNKNTLRKYGNACLAVVFIENSSSTHTPQLDVHIQEQNKPRTTEAKQSKRKRKLIKGMRILILY